MPETEGKDYENTESKMLNFISTQLKVKLDANDIEQAESRQVQVSNNQVF